CPMQSPYQSSQIEQTRCRKRGPRAQAEAAPLGRSAEQDRASPAPWRAKCITVLESMRTRRSSLAAARVGVRRFRPIQSTLRGGSRSWLLPPCMGGPVMLRWALVFLVVALLAALFGFTTVAGDAYLVAKILFFVFLVLSVAALLLNPGP